MHFLLCTSVRRHHVACRVYISRSQYLWFRLNHFRLFSLGMCSRCLYLICVPCRAHRADSFPPWESSIVAWFSWPWRSLVPPPNCPETRFAAFLIDNWSFQHIWCDTTMLRKILIEEKLQRGFRWEKLQSFSNLTARSLQRRWHVAGIGRILLEVNMILAIIQRTATFSYRRQEISDSLAENERCRESDSFLVISATFWHTTSAGKTKLECRNSRKLYFSWDDSEISNSVAKM